MKLILNESNTPNLSEQFVWDNVYYVVKYVGFRKWGPHKEVRQFMDEHENDPYYEFKDFDICVTQPIEIKPFLDAYWYTVHELNRRDLEFFKTFYREWIKDPSAFEPPEDYDSEFKYERGLDLV